MSTGLSHFALCYFNQDWDLQYATADEAVADFLAGEPALKQAVVIDQIGDLLNRNLTEDEMADHWHTKLGGSYEPGREGSTYREWFEKVRDAITVRLEELST